MLAGVCRRAAYSRAATVQRQSLLCLHRFHPRPSTLPFSTSAPLRNHQGPTAKDQRRKDWLVVRKLIGNVWPKHDWNTRFRVVFGFALLIGGKVPLPIHLERDRCSPCFQGLERTSPTTIQGCHRRSQSRRLVCLDRLGRRGLPHPRLCVATFLTCPISRSPDGAARVGATVFGELLNAVFANIGQRAIRKVSRETFEHLLNLNLKFHLSRQTGGLTRAIDRGTKSVSLFSDMTFPPD